jgi:hypothetical protein
VAAEEKRLSTSVENYTEDDISLARLDAGLYTLQQVRLLQLPPLSLTFSHSLSPSLTCSWPHHRWLIVSCRLLVASSLSSDFVCSTTS